MNPINYSEIAVDALDAIREAGTTGVLARFSKTLDPVEGQTSAVTVSKGSIDLVSLPVKSRDVADSMNDTLKEAFIKGKLRKFLIAAHGAPYNSDVGDFIQFQSAFFKVLGNTILAPSGVAVIFTVIAEITNLSTADLAAFNA